ncbi:hypothetical protein [Tahibacter amnicola]|uniref:Glycosyltransferase RgtA/B/C/D-like domain-containing protein n=1 Tax=Tahibacter amnicola TaxID=2976241 RepID=A0ABY6BGT6_9GAMM|nr:hypothetical protein [Tahibacter amnicola]UXI69233.1 hypothetical protein N4264_06180 [Tahibacter amnicola]
MALDALVVAVAALAFWPALSAGVTPEDWSWLAMGRHLDDPLVATYQNVFFTYFYRPVGLLSWWFTGHVFEADAWWHNAFDLALHVGNALLLAHLATRLTGDVIAGRLAGILFGVMPIGIGTAIWLSDRFDPLAALFGLLALLAYETAFRQHRRYWLVFTGLLLAMASKEVAYAVAGAMLVHAAVDAWTQRRLRWDLAAPVAAAVASAVALRFASGTGAASALGDGAGMQAIITGIGAWWWRLPSAIAGFSSDWRWTAGLSAPLLVAQLTPWAAALRRPSAAPWPAILIGATLLVVPAILQWPIVRQALAVESGLISLNLRFYYLAGIGLALGAGAAIASLRDTRRRRVGVALLACVTAAAFLRAHQVSTHWSATYGREAAQMTQLGKAVAAHSYTGGCQIELAMPHHSDDIRQHIDTIVKAMAPRGASVMTCAVYAGLPVYSIVLDAAWCDAARWPALRVAQFQGRPLMERFGNLCTAQFEEPDHARSGPGVYHFSVDAEGHLAPTPKE